MTSPDPSRRWALIKRREKGPEDVPASQRRQGFQERDAVYAQVPESGSLNCDLLFVCLFNKQLIIIFGFFCIQNNTSLKGDVERAD